MGNPVVDSAPSSSRDVSSIHCPLLTQGRDSDRNPFRRLRPVPLYDDTHHRSLAWTRNIRQRGEVMHTLAPELEDSLALDLGQASAEQEMGEDAKQEDLSEKDAKGHCGRHKYRLRLGYDPRIFLEDPRMRCHQLSPAAEKWATEYRSQIPMATAPQLARRFTPEQSRQTQTESGDMLRARRDSRAPLLQRARAGSLDERAYDVSGEDSEEDDDEPRREADSTNDNARLSQPMAFLSDILLNGVSPDDYTSRVEDSLAVLGQALRATAGRTVGVQAAGSYQTRAPVTPAMLANLDEDEARENPGGSEARRTVNRRSITRIAGYIQRQAGGGSASLGPQSDIV